MSGLIENLKTLKDAKEVIEDEVSLETLLLDESTQQTAVTGASPLPPQTPQTENSRKSRRKKIKSNRVVAKKSSVGQSAREQMARKTSLYQERNREALLSRQKQSNSKNMSGSEVNTLRRGNQLTTKKTGTEKIGEMLRPVVLANIDFDPCYTSTKSPTGAGKLLTVKRAVRRLNIDKQIKIDLESSTFPEIPLAAALKKYNKTKSLFSKSLDPVTSLGMYKEAMGALELTLEENVSNTEILYTLVREYSHALQYCTSRLDEAPSRSVDGDIKMLPPKKHVYEALFASLKKGRPASSFFKAIPTDKEVSVKCLISILAKEILASFNELKTGTLNGTTIDRFSATRYSRTVLESPNNITSSTSALGIVFSDNVVNNGSIEKVICYPFESSNVINEKVPTKSSLTFLNDLTRKESDTTLSYSSKIKRAQYSTPYDAVSDNYAQLSGAVASLLDTSNLELGDSAYVGLLNNMMSGILTNLNDATSDSATALQCQILNLASSNNDILAMLLVYLAFRSERLGIATTSSDGSNPIVQLLTKDSYIRSYVGSLDAGKVTKVFNIDPQKIELDPGVDGQTDFSAPDKPQTATLETEPQEFEEGTLESRYRVSFEEICQGFANQVNNHIAALSSKSTPFSVSSEVSIGLPSVYDALSDVNSQGSIFDYLINFDQTISSAIPSADPDVVSIYRDGSRGDKTVFSRVYRRCIFLAFTKATCDIFALLLDGKTSITTSRKVTISTTSSGKRTVKAAGRGIKAMLLKGTPSSKDPTITIDYSSDFASSLQDLQAYLNNEEVDFDDISVSYPLVSSVGASLLEEEQFLGAFHNSLSSYFSALKMKFKLVDSVLGERVGQKTLRELINSGIVPSVDTARILSYFYWLLNQEKMMSYSGVKTFDHTIGPASLKYLKKRLKGERFLKKKKVFVIGIPAGLLEETETTPAEISEIRKEQTSDNSKFKIVVQKIDQVRPEVEYEDLEFQFSRNWLAVRSENGQTVYIDPIANDGSVKNQPEWITSDHDFSDQLGESIMMNTRDDFVLKLWCDLQLNLDFFETAFPKSIAAKNQVKNATVDLSILKGADLSSVDFLSGSNLAFDPQQRNLENFKFFDSDTSTLSLGGNKYTGTSTYSDNDPYSVSAFEYAGSYGSIFNPEPISQKYNGSVEFERVLCILIDDDEFKVQQNNVEDGDREINAQMNQQRLSEKEISIGQPTSAGVDLNTYRFSIVMEDE